MRTIDEYLKLPYTIETVRDADGSYFIRVKELKGCMSVGDTLEEAYEMIQDAMRLWIGLALEDGAPIPEPALLNEKEYSGKFVVRIPKNLHKELAETAEENGISLNQYVASILSRYCGILETKDRIIQIQNEIIAGEQKEYSFSEESTINLSCNNITEVNFQKFTTKNRIEEELEN